MWFILLSSKSSIELGLLFIRMGIGLIFVIHGFMKLAGGPQKWIWLGSQLVPFGIAFLPVIWGFIAANAEFIGGLCLIFGLGTRIATLFIACTMIVALMYHLNNGDSWTIYSYALSMLVVMIGLFLSGPSKYSLDEYIYNKKRSEVLVNK